MMMMNRAALVLAIVAALLPSVRGDGHLCVSPNNVFTMKLNLSAGELGEYRQTSFHHCVGAGQSNQGVLNGSAIV